MNRKKRKVVFFSLSLLLTFARYRQPENWKSVTGAGKKCVERNEEKRSIWCHFSLFSTSLELCESPFKLPLPTLVNGRRKKRERSWWESLPFLYPFSRRVVVVVAFAVVVSAAEAAAAVDQAQERKAHRVRCSRRRPIIASRRIDSSFAFHGPNKGHQKFKESLFCLTFANTVSKLVVVRESTRSGLHISPVDSKTTSNCNPYCTFHSQISLKRTFRVSLIFL